MEPSFPITLVHFKVRHVTKSVFFLLFSLLEFEVAWIYIATSTACEDELDMHVIFPCVRRIMLVASCYLRQ